MKIATSVFNSSNPASLRPVPGGSSALVSARMIANRIRGGAMAVSSRRMSLAGCASGAADSPSTAPATTASTKAPMMRK